MASVLGGGGADVTFALLATLESVGVHSRAHFPAGLVSAAGVCLARLAAARSRGRDQSRSEESAGRRRTEHLPAPCFISGADVSAAEPGEAVAP